MSLQVNKIKEKLSRLTNKLKLNIIIVSWTHSFQWFVRLSDCRDIQLSQVIYHPTEASTHHGVIVVGIVHVTTHFRKIFFDLRNITVLLRWRFFIEDQITLTRFVPIGCSIENKLKFTLFKHGLKIEVFSSSLEQIKKSFLYLLIWKS